MKKKTAEFPERDYVIMGTSVTTESNSQMFRSRRTNMRTKIIGIYKITFPKGKDETVAQR